MLRQKSNLRSKVFIYTLYTKYLSMCENVPNWSPAHYWQKKNKKSNNSIS